jgi:hypothetical protein
MALLPQTFFLAPSYHSGMCGLAQIRNPEEFNAFQVPGSTLGVVPE